MITAVALALFVDKNGWIVIEKNEYDFIRYLTPAGQMVTVEFKEDGCILQINQSNIAATPWGGK